MVSAYLLIMTAVLVMTLLVKLFQLDKNLSLFRRRDYFSGRQMMKDLPSVSICIPARNEFKAMNECLELTLASRYPKLEIIVIDDDSVDETPQIVKTFAHEGVRFIAGGDVPRGWLGKNYALDRLLREANGSYVLFMDVDTKLSPDTVGQLVSYMENNRLTMMSALPRRRNVWQRSSLFAPFRYFWRVMFHDSRHPIAASSAWMIRRKEFIDEIGGFSHLSSVVEPETELARVFIARQAYQFLISDDMLGLSYEKRWSSQVETSIRLRYPALRFSWLRTVGAMLVLALYCVVPLIVAVTGLALDDWSLVFAGSLLYLLEVFCYHVYLKTVWPERNKAGALVVPILLAEDVVLTFVSFINYSRHTVTWKGRAIEPTQPNASSMVFSEQSKN